MSYNNPTFGEGTPKEESSSVENTVAFKVTLKPLMGNDTATFNATINALRAGSFINFSAHFEAELSAFFTGAEYEDCVNSKKFNLAIGYSKLAVGIVATCFNEVLKQRELELAPLLQEKEVAFNELSGTERLRYLLLYQYGDKIGGYPALAGMSIAEVIKLYHYFDELNKEKNKSLKQAMEKKHA